MTARGWLNVKEVQEGRPEAISKAEMKEGKNLIKMMIQTLQDRNIY